MNNHKIFNILGAFLLLSFFAACEGEEEYYDWTPAGTLHIIGSGSVPVLSEASYRVDGFTTENDYTWTLNGNPIEPVRLGEFANITLPEPGEYQLAVSNGRLDDTLTITALPVTLGLAGNSATVTENSDTISIPLSLSYEDGGTALSGAATVDYTLGGTAVAGEDYTLVSSDPLMVKADREDTVIQVVLLDNMLQEDAKTLTVTLNSVTAEGTTAGVALPADSLRTYTLTIDNDQKLLSLTEPAVDTLSSVTTAGTYTFVAMLSAATGGDVTVPYTVSGNGVEDLTEGEVTFITGQTESNIIIRVTPEAFAATQTVLVTLGSDITTTDEEVAYETDAENNPVGAIGTIVVVAPE